MTRILVVDDEEAIRLGFAEALAPLADAFRVEAAASGDEALAILREKRFDLVFTDLRMPGKDGLAVVREGRQLQPAAEFVMITAYGGVGTAVDAIKGGAYTYLEKPFTREELVTHVRQVAAAREDRLMREEEARGFERFTPSMRFQHIVLIATFALLTITGLPLLFPETFKGVFFFEDSSMLRGVMHRVSAVALMLLSAYHVLWVMMSDDGHSNMRAILPSLPRDLKDGLGDFLFLVGLRKSRPPAGKYDWIEKFEYFAVVWGTIVMVVSGLALWFADAILRVAPLWVIDVAKVVHRYEAILAILSVVVWHMYTVHFRPGVFPMSRVWLDGRISRSQMIHHHPLEYERLTGRTAGGHGEGAGEVRS